MRPAEQASGENRPRCRRGTALWILAIAAAVLGPILYYAARPPRTEGADERARQAILDIHTGYRPWFTLPWAPPGAAAEALLFACQAGAGVAVLAWAIVRLRAGRKP